MGDEYLNTMSDTFAKWLDDQQLVKNRASAKTTANLGEWIMPFGKFRGLTLDQIAVTDPAYLMWMQSQPDFPLEVRNYDVRGRPNMTPTHNAMQVKFLEQEYRVGVAVAVLHPVFEIAAQTQKLKKWYQDVKATCEGKCQEAYSEYVAGHEQEKKRCETELAKPLLSLEEWREANPSLGEGNYKGTYLHNRKVYEQNLAFKYKSYGEYEDGFFTGSNVHLGIKLKRAKEILDVLDKETLSLGVKVSDAAFEQAADAIFWVTRGLRLGTFDIGDDYEPIPIKYNIPIIVELKPLMGDDYPEVMRQIQRQKQQASGNWVLLVGEFHSEAITLKQAKLMFANNDVTMLLASEVEDTIERMKGFVST